MSMQFKKKLIVNCLTEVLVDKYSSFDPVTIVTVSFTPGVPLGVQFVVVFQLVEVLPFHV